MSVVTDVTGIPDVTLFLLSLVNVVSCVVMFLTDQLKLNRAACPVLNGTLGYLEMPGRVFVSGVFSVTLSQPAGICQDFHVL